MTFLLDDLPRPQPDKIQNISWSVFKNLRSCPKRVAFSNDDQLKRFGQSVYSLLGSIAHDFRESAGQRFPLGETDAEQLWDEVAENELQDAITRSFTGSPPPEPSSWPNYSQTRQRSIDLAVVEPRDKDATFTPGTPIKVELEKWIAPKSIPAVARLDLLITTDGVAKIGELKAGKRDEEHVDQVLFYSAVFEAESGKWPSRLWIEYMSDDTKIPVRVDKEKATALLSEALEARQEFNADAKSGEPVAADPSPSNCKYCPYKPICSAYHLSGIVAESRTNESVVFVLKTKGNSTSSVVDVVAGDRFKTEHVMIYPPEVDDMLEVGSTYAVGNSTGRDRGEVIELKWNSLVWHLP